MSAGAYSVALEVDATGTLQRYVLRAPDGGRVASAPATVSHKRKLEQDAASRNRMARERARKEVSQ